MTCIERLQASGIRRRGDAKRGFRWVCTAGGRLGADDVERIRRLRLPPAWRDVVVSASPSARVQAIGRDAAGRWQYVYHPDHVRRRERRKYERLVRFGAALPRLRRAVASDIEQRGLTRDRVIAAMVRILGSAFLRPGSEAYAAENGSYGLTTLRRRHVVVRGAAIHFDFPAKSGKRMQRSLRDKSVARVLRLLLAQSGDALFRYVDAEGQRVCLKSADINEYVKRQMGGGFTAKDFRTWNGTLLCACLLARAHEGPALPARRAIAAAIKETAHHLGNTPAVCRTSYVCPDVLRSFERGRVLESTVSIEEIVGNHVRGLRAAERALLRLLDGRPGASRPAEPRAPLRAAA